MATPRRKLKLHVIWCNPRIAKKKKAISQDCVDIIQGGEGGKEREKGYKIVPYKF